MIEDDDTGTLDTGYRGREYWRENVRRTPDAQTVKELANELDTLASASTAAVVDTGKEEVMDELEVCRLSAEALGKSIQSVESLIKIVHYTGARETWNPLTNAEQRWECVEWLLKNGYSLFMGPSFSHKAFRPEYGEIWISGSASGFPARAVAELQRRRNGRS